MLPQCIVFDLDDTLYLERDYVRSGFRVVGEWAKTSLGVPDFSDRAWRLFESGMRGTTFQTALAECGRNPEPGIVAHMVNLYRCHSPEIELLPDAVHCLSKLKGKALLGIVTDGVATCQNAKCTSLGLRNLFDIIVCTGEWGEEFYKPHPRAFEFIQKKFSDGGRAFAYVADNPIKDFHAPIALGWDTVRVRRLGALHFEKEALENFAPKLEIPNLWNLPELIEDFSPLASAGGKSY